MAEHDPERLKRVRTAGMYAMIPAIMFTSPLIGYVLGGWLMRWLGTGEWLRVTMMMLGMVAGGREVVRIIRQASREND